MKRMVCPYISVKKCRDCGTTNVDHRELIRCGVCNSFNVHPVNAVDHVGSTPTSRHKEISAHTFSSGKGGGKQTWREFLKEVHEGT